MEREGWRGKKTNCWDKITKLRHLGEHLGRMGFCRRRCLPFGTNVQKTKMCAVEVNFKESGGWGMEREDA